MDLDTKNLTNVITDLAEVFDLGNNAVDFVEKIRKSKKNNKKQDKDGAIITSSGDGAQIGSSGGYAKIGEDRLKRFLRSV